VSWSRDGTTIAFVGNDPNAPGAGSDTGETDTDSRLYGIDADDGSVRVLARHVCLCGPPEWQPAP
jgi:Tol biopolymer transport system component